MQNVLASDDRRQKNRLAERWPMSHARVSIGNTAAHV